MKGCMGCFAFLVVMAALGAVIQGVTFVFANYWAPIIGLSAAWMSHRYVHSWYDEDES